MDKQKLGLLVITSQLLLLALALAWGLHTAIVAKHGAVCFVEPNPLILWGEITATELIAVFGAAVFTLQARKLREDF